MKKNYFELLCRVALFFISPLLFASLSCNDNPTSNNDIKPGRRDYTWTVDTLIVPPNTYMSITRMWGNSVDDIWATGDAEESRLSIWHYDGKKWTCNNTPRPMMPRGIWGTNSNNIWIGNINGSFWHYNGSNWYEYSKHSLPGYSDLVNQSICGDAPNNIYAVGMADNRDGSGHKAIIQKFNGTTWEFLNIPKLVSNFVKIKKDNTKNIFFINSMYEENTATTDKYFILQNNSIKEIYATEKTTGLSQFGNEVYFQIGDENYYKYDGKQIVFWKEFKYPSLYLLEGRNEKDFFVRTVTDVKHYNGTDLETAFSTTAHIIAGLIFEKEVIFLGKDFDKNLCLTYKGVLKE